MKINIEAAGLTDPGQVRTNNEDNLYFDPDRGLFVVADGMGGHASGETASQMAVDIIKEQVEKGLDTRRIPSIVEKPLHISERGYLLLNSVHMSNEIVYGASQSNIKNKGMGTTVTALLVDKDKFAVAQVGDSRLYLLRDGVLKQVSRDHSLVAEQVAKGLITEEQAEQSDIKNVLTRALGISDKIEVDIDEYKLKSGDRFLLCSDGLVRMVDNKTIEEKLKSDKTPKEICDELISLANEGGGKDNITLIVVKISKVGFWDKLLKR